MGTALSMPRSLRRLGTKDIRVMNAASRNMVIKLQTLGVWLALNIDVMETDEGGVWSVYPEHFGVTYRE